MPGILPGGISEVPGIYDFWRMKELDLKVFKREMHQHCLQVLEEKISMNREQLKALQESADEETRSTMGDQYETGRAMLHLEMEKYTTQVENSVKQREMLGKFDPALILDKIQPGCLMKCNDMLYYFAISLGQVEVKGRKVFLLSISAPFSTACLGLKEGDSFSFNNRTFKIQEVC
jgi:hypothetical protein